MFKDNSNKTSPVTYNLRKKERKLVDRISDAKGISKSEFIRDAVQLYAIVDAKLKEKQRLAFVGSDGKVTPIEMIWNDDIVTHATREELVEAAKQAAISICTNAEDKHKIFLHTCQGLVHYGQSLIDNNKTYQP